MCIYTVFMSAKSTPKLYNPRLPERTLLYQMVAEYYENWLELASSMGKETAAPPSPMYARRLADTSNVAFLPTACAIVNPYVASSANYIYRGSIALSKKALSAGFRVMASGFQDLTKALGGRLFHAEIPLSILNMQFLASSPK
jgi:hypothetical protein